MKQLLVASFLLATVSLFSQTNNFEQATSIRADGSAPDPSAILDVQATDKGMLIPRLTSGQRTGISSPADGLLVYDTQTNGFWYYDGGWNELGNDSKWAENGSDIYYTTGGVAIGKASTVYDLEIDGSTSRPLDILNNYAGSSSKYGMRAQVATGGTGIKYGIVSDVNNDPGSTQRAYGVFTDVSNDGTGTHYGVHSTASGAGNYAIYGVNTSSAGYAGYFNGKGHFTDDLSMDDKVKLNSSVSGTVNGQVELFAGTSRTIRIQAKQSSYNNPSIRLMPDGSSPTISLTGNYSNTGRGRIITDELEIRGGSDLAENFAVSSSEDVELEPGMLVSIDPGAPGKLCLTAEAYDPKVAGIVSGANGVNTGLFMGQKGSEADGGVPIALAGRVYVLADAKYGEIKPGDLLTSSPTSGHVMKVKKRKKAQGAVVGKAMSSLENGKGYVFVLVNLQ